MFTTVLTLTSKEEVLDSYDLCNRIIMCYGSDQPIDNKYWSGIHSNSSQCRYDMAMVSSCAMSSTSHNIKTTTNTTSTSNLEDIQDEYLINMLEALCGRRRQSIIQLCKTES